MLAPRSSAPVLGDGGGGCCASLVGPILKLPEGKAEPLLLSLAQSCVPRRIPKPP